MASFKKIIQQTIITVVCTFLASAILLLCLFAAIITPVLMLIGGMRETQRVYSILAEKYWINLVRLTEGWGKWNVIFSGDKIPDRETALIMANHRWYLDWLVVFSLAARKGRLGCMKMFVKEAVIFVPGLGLGIKMMGYVFLKRNWADDSKAITDTFAALKSRKLPFWLMSHLEGTRYSEENIKKSQAFSKKKDLPVLNHLLLPRTKGFMATIQSLRDISDAVYDIILINPINEEDPSVKSVFFREGRTIHIHVRRYTFDQIPTDDEGVSKWIIDRWQEKDQIIDNYRKTGQLPNIIDEPFVYKKMNI